MELKIGKMNRLRMNEQEYSLLSKERCIGEKFQITPNLNLDVKIELQQDETGSQIEFTKGEIKIQLSQQDCDLLVDKNQKRNGIQLAHYFVQVDVMKNGAKSL